MKNIISISGGNDSIAMLQWVIENREHFEDEEFTAVYVNTGWAVSWWADRVAKVKQFCENNNIYFYEISAPLGFEELVRKKGIFPNRIQKYCTFELKIKPMVNWRKEMKFTNKNSRILIGVRADESAARSETVSLGERDGYEAIYPLAYLNDVKRDELIVRSGFDVLPTRSSECHPCIYEASKTALRRIEPDRVELISALEKDLSDYTNAKRKLNKHPKYDPTEVFGMFNSKNLGGNGGKGGIKEQIKWAKSARGKYTLGQEDMFCDDQIGYCGD
jgi:hypothetical protein